MALLACCAKFLCFAQLGGDAFAPELPEKLIWAWNVAYSGAVILAALAVVAWKLPVRFKRVPLPVLAWTLAAVGVWNGIKDPVAQEVVLEFPDLPAALEGYRIVQLSDLHVSAAARRTRSERIVALANAQRADLMVVTGDIVDGNPDTRLSDVEPFRNLMAKDGVWWIAGNHEGYFNFDEWQPWYRRWGMNFLNHDCVFPRSELALAGVNDATKDGAAECFRGVTNGQFRLFLQHRPARAAANVAEVGADLVLSGHTHGGILPGLDRIVRLYNGGYVRGVYQLKDNPRPGWLYVSSGTGQWAGFPVRYFNPAEITVITLRRHSH